MVDPLVLADRAYRVLSICQQKREHVMRIALLIGILLLIGCQRPVDPPPKAEHHPQKMAYPPDVDIEPD
jgi:hypothetical protein